jgi:hypothetical protein
MFKRTGGAVMAAIVVSAASTVHAQTTRYGVELIDQWSVFTCKASNPGRFWHLTLNGSQLSATGPEGAAWTTTVSSEGAFKTPFTGYWQGQPFEAEVTGNVKTDWFMFHNITAMCWYRLVPA